MQAADLRKYIEDPALLDKQSVKQLQKLVDDFPYFQSAHVLLSIASKKWDTSIYQQSLKKTAIVVSNRSHLFNLIHQLETNEEESKKQIETGPETTTGLVIPVKENTKQELDILKATEISSEPAPEQKTEIPSGTEKSVLSAEQVLEKEIEKQVVTAFVEREIIKTPDLHKSKIDKQEAESFVEWLSLLKKNNGQSYEQIEKQVNYEKSKNQRAKETKEKTELNELDSQQLRKEKNKAIIDKIIETSPGLIRQKDEQKFYTPDNKAKESLLENEHLVTETLARIYALQGNVNKAVRAYEILSLKFPQKSAYFASLIQKLKNN